MIRIPHLIRRYAHWLHTRWPAGGVERLPVVRDDYSTRVPGLYVVGDLAGVPLFKFSADSGARAVRTILADPRFQNRPQPSPMDSMAGIDPPLDLVIVGAGVAGMSAALEAREAGLRFLVVESAEPFSTIARFLRGKPIYTYPTRMTPAGSLRFIGATKELLLEDLRAQTLGRGLSPAVGEVRAVTRRGGLLEVQLAPDQEPESVDDPPMTGEEAHRVRGIRPPRPLMAHRVIVAIGRSGAYRMLNVSGEELDKVYNRLHDPRDFAGQRCLVVGGGDNALETAAALTGAGAAVTLSYRGSEFRRAKPENVERVTALAQSGPGTHSVSAEPTPADSLRESGSPRGSLKLLMPSRVTAIREDVVELARDADRHISVGNDVAFTMIGRDAPLDLFRRSGVPIHGERDARWWGTLVLMLAAAMFVYHWKKGGVYLGIAEAFARNNWFPYNVPQWWAGLGAAFNNPAHLLGTLKVSLGEAGFYYALAYCVAVVVFGIRRVRRRRTPYITLQTTTLAVIQVVPLFLLPYILLPWMGNNGWFDSGVGAAVADALFPVVDYGHGREYWRAFGLILAWPLFIWNVFTSQPLWAWLAISAVQTFVIIPAIVYFWGKGAYCGWVCSCGALAETMGDAHREKMPHGLRWNRLNMIGQAFLAFALLLFVLRVLAWVWPGSFVGGVYYFLLSGLPVLNYVWFVDLFWAGVLGVGLYFHFSGRVWCRFACPLAALMHIYARFSRFRILADKKRCISCNVCTTVCHQGIDVMSFANKGEPMDDPQCVRCSACVQSCPTGVLSFGQVGRGGEVIARDPAWLAASPVLMAEVTVNGKKRRRGRGA